MYLFKKIRIKLRCVTDRLALSISKMSQKIYLYPQEKRVAAWFKVDGDKTFRLNYNLNPNSIVFDLGGYEGQWTSDIYAKYNCYIYVFEPVKEYNQKLKKRFNKNNKIKVFEFGLGGTTRETMISKNGDSSSIVRGKGNEVIRLKAFEEFIREYSISEIDLMKINIEGAEYELVNSLIRLQLIKNIKNIQIQFHDFVPNADVEMGIIHKKLNVTHKLTWQYEFVWENWTVRRV